MGASNSSAKIVTDQVVEAISEVINKTIQECSASNTAVQKINISGLTLENCNLQISDLSQSIDSSVDLNCALTTANEATANNEILQKLNTLAESFKSGIGIGLSNQSSEQIASVKTRIENKVVNENIFRTVLTKVNDQLINISNLKILNCPSIAPTVTISNLNQLLVTKSVSEALGEVISNTEFDNIVKQDTSQTSTITNEGFDPIKFIQSLQLPSIIAIGVFGLVMLIASIVGITKLMKKVPNIPTPQFSQFQNQPGINLPYGSIPLTPSS